jgi:uncharacterized protein (DUF302 family)
MMTSFETQLGHTRALNDVPVEDAVRRITEALAGEGFGVLTRVDLDETLKKKIGADFRRYVILGACNPKIAHRALSARLDVGLLLPCNVTVFSGDAGETVVQIVKPLAMGQLVPHEELRPLMEDADQRLQRALERM